MSNIYYSLSNVISELDKLIIKEEIPEVKSRAISPGYTIALIKNPRTKRYHIFVRVGRTITPTHEDKFLTIFGEIIESNTLREIKSLLIKTSSDITELLKMYAKEIESANIYEKISIRHTTLYNRSKSIENLVKDDKIKDILVSDIKTLKLSNDPISIILYRKADFELDNYELSLVYEILNSNSYLIILLKESEGGGEKKYYYNLFLVNKGPKKLESELIMYI